MVCMSHSLLATSAVNQTNFSKSIIGQASNSIIDSESIKAMCEFDYLSLILHTSHLYGFSHLSLHVVCNICWLNKPLLIHITCVGSLSCVSLHMCIQIPWWNITLITHSTFVVSFLCEFDPPPPPPGGGSVFRFGGGGARSGEFWFGGRGVNWTVLQFLEMVAISVQYFQCIWPNLKRKWPKQNEITQRMWLWMY